MQQITSIRYFLNSEDMAEVYFSTHEEFENELIVRFYKTIVENVLLDFLTKFQLGGFYSCVELPGVILMEENIGLASTF